MFGIKKTRLRAGINVTRIHVRERRERKSVERKRTFLSIHFPSLYHTIVLCAPHIRQSLQPSPKYLQCIYNIINKTFDRNKIYIFINLLFKGSNVRRTKKEDFKRRHPVRYRNKIRFLIIRNGGGRLRIRVCICSRDLRRRI